MGVSGVGTGTGAYGSSTTGHTGTHGTTGFGSRDTSFPEGTTGTYGQTTVGGGIVGTSGTSGFSSAGTGAHGPSHTSGLPEGSTGPHNSRAANAADPRVDSDRDGSHQLGNRGVGAGAGTTNYGSSTGTHGTQGTSMGGAGGAYGTGPAPNTAGPHKSDMLNKADPRVDSNLDGSKTVGRDKTFERS